MKPSKHISNKQIIINHFSFSLIEKIVKKKLANKKTSYLNNKFDNL